MKIKAPPKDYRQSLNIRGAIYVRNTRWGPVVQKWPRKRGPPKTPYDKFRQAEFAWVAHQASQPLPVEYDTAVFLTKGTLLMPRDLLMMAMYGSAIEFSMPDGTILPEFRKVTNNPQYVLDQVTDEVGTMLYRSPDGWVWVDPGSNGTFLTMIDKTPIWVTLPFADGGATSTRQLAGLGTSSTGYATKGVRLNIIEQQFLTRVQFQIAAAVGGTYELNVAKYVGTTITELMIDPIPFTTTTTTPQVITIDLEDILPLEPATDYAVTVTRTGVSGTTSNGLYSRNTPSFGLPLTPLTDVYVRSTAAPYGVGSTIQLGGNADAPYAISETMTY